MCVQGACLCVCVCVFRVRGVEVCGLYVEIQNILVGRSKRPRVCLKTHACCTHAYTTHEKLRNC